MVKRKNYCQRGYGPWIFLPDWLGCCCTMSGWNLLWWMQLHGCLHQSTVRVAFGCCSSLRSGGAWGGPVFHLLETLGFRGWGFTRFLNDCLQEIRRWTRTQGCRSQKCRLRLLCDSRRSILQFGCWKLACIWFQHWSLLWAMVRLGFLGKKVTVWFTRPEGHGGSVVCSGLCVLWHVYLGIFIFQKFIIR